MFSEIFRSACESPRKRNAFLTISVDDGHPTDLRTAELLTRLDLQGTFYIPARNSERPVMCRSEIVELSKRFEIGSHTMNHRRVHRLSDLEARNEIEWGKKWLEDILSQGLNSFCYPGGKYTRRTRRIVADLGFLGARTCQINVVMPPSDPYRWGISTQAYSRSVFRSVRNNTFRGTLDQLMISRLRDWEIHFIRCLNWVETYGGVAHLYIHSWEIDSLGQWDKLERALFNAAARPGMSRVTNGELFALWHQNVSIRASDRHLGTPNDHRV